MKKQAVTQNVIFDLNYSQLNSIIRTEDKNGRLLGSNGIYSNGYSEINDEIILHRFGYLKGTMNALDLLGKILNNIEKDERMPANESTKMILIEDDRDAIEINQRKEYHSQLKNLISSMINCEGFKYNHSQVWDMKINAFMDSVKRITKIKNANLLLQSGYSGFGINLKDVDKKQLNWLGELD